MRKIYSIDQKVFNADSELILGILTDFDTYNLWFPSKIKTRVITNNKKVIGSKLEVEYSGKKFYVEIIRVTDSKEIMVEYSGLYSGRGIWYILPGEEGTKVMYEVDLTINNMFVNFISYFTDLNIKHSELMKEIFSGLENYIRKLSNDEKSDFGDNGDIQPKTFNLTGS